MLRLAALAAFLGAGVASAADVTVRETHGRVDLAATATPLADVLDRLARQTGMKVVYEGQAPRQLVTLTLAARSPAEIVSAILEGQGLNYALVLDASATRVEKLLVTGGSTGATSSTSSAPRRASLPPALTTHRPPPDEEPEDELDGQEDAAANGAAPLAPGGAPAPAGDEDAASRGSRPSRPGSPMAAAPPGPTAAPSPAPPPLVPNPAYSSSPFNPRPTPFFPPAPAPAPTPTPAPPP